MLRDVTFLTFHYLLLKSGSSIPDWEIQACVDDSDVLFVSLDMSVISKYTAEIPLKASQRCNSESLTTFHTWPRNLEMLV